MAQQNGNQLKSVEVPKHKVIQGLKALSEKDLDELQFRDGMFVGICMVAVEDTKNQLNVFVKKSNVPDQLCFRHHDHPMTKSYVKKTEGAFAKSTVFYQCYEEIGIQGGNQTLCRDNCYPQYPLEQLTLEL